MNEVSNVGTYVYIVSHIVFNLAVFFGYPIYMLWKHGKCEETMGLPRGSVRSILAFGIAGNFLIIATLGPLFIDSNYFDDIMKFMSVITTSVTSYYYGSRNGNGH